MIALVGIFRLGVCFYFNILFQDYLLIEYGISVVKISCLSVGEMLFAILIMSFLSALVPSFYVYRKYKSSADTVNFFDDCESTLVTTALMAIRLEWANSLHSVDKELLH